MSFAASLYHRPTDVVLSRFSLFACDMFVFDLAEPTETYLLRYADKIDRAGAQ